jgi:hypothetical protein
MGVRFGTGIVAAVAVLMALAQPAAAASFDGRWTADLPAQGNCHYTSTMTLMVLNGDIQGQIQNPGNMVGVVGKVDDSGNGTVTVARVSPGTIRFNGDRFEADWSNRECARHAGGSRAITGDAQAALAAARKQHQDAFADLVRRANAGEAVDYNKLRAEYVYSENWDFYGSRIGPLMNQANLAAKGKDCVRTLQITEQILSFDFTIDSAHALRADCLHDNDRPRSRIEQNIADGLVHSLMDSGDGDSEKAPYVVVTQREEMDVLANRRIQLRTRQTEVHGSDGRTFDIIEGVAVRTQDIFRSGLGLSTVQHVTNGTAKTVYFDIGSFERGRESRRAVVATAAASVH